MYLEKNGKMHFITNQDGTAKRIKVKNTREALFNNISILFDVIIIFYGDFDNGTSQYSFGVDNKACMSVKIRYTNDKTFEYYVDNNDEKANQLDRSILLREPFYVSLNALKYSGLPIRLTILFFV